jgi:integrase
MARLRGNRWQADVLVDGVRKRVSFKTQAEAEDYEKAVEGGYKPSASNTLGDFVDEAFDKLWGIAKSRKYIEGNWRVIYRYIPRDTALDKINDALVEKMVISMKRDGKQGGTINRKMANLTKLLKEAKRKGRLMTLPDFTEARQPEGNARELTMSREQERAVNLYFDHIGKPVAKHLFNFLLYTGCRMNEALTLDRKRVTPGRSVIFHHTLSKTSTTRTVPLVPQAAEAWAEVCKLTNSPTPFGELMPYWTFRDHWASLKAHLKVDEDEFVPHMLRHTCATRLVIAGVPLPMVMKWLGHKSIQVTMRYTNLVPDDLDVAAKALAMAA